MTKLLLALTYSLTLAFGTSKVTSTPSYTMIEVRGANETKLAITSWVYSNGVLTVFVDTVYRDGFESKNGVNKPNVHRK